MEVYGNNAPSYDTVAQMLSVWSNNLNYKEQSSRQSLCEELAISRDLEDLMFEDQHITVKEIMEKVKISVDKFSTSCTTF